MPFASNGSSAMDFRGVWTWTTVTKQGFSATLSWPFHATVKNALPEKMLNWKEIREKTE